MFLPGSLTFTTCLCIGEIHSRILGSLLVKNCFMIMAQKLISSSMSTTRQQRSMSDSFLREDHGRSFYGGQRSNSENAAQSPIHKRRPWSMLFSSQASHLYNVGCRDVVYSVFSCNPVFKPLQTMTKKQNLTLTLTLAIPTLTIP